MSDQKKTYSNIAEYQAKGDWNPIWNQAEELDADFSWRHASPSAASPTRKARCRRNTKNSS